MAVAAHRHQVFFFVWTGLATPEDMVNLKPIAPAAGLAFPSIAFENPRFQNTVLLSVEA